MNLALTRFAYLNYCTLGILHVDDLYLKTIERPWIKNPEGDGGMPMSSCVPDGDYTLIPHSSPKFPNTYQLIGYPHGVYESQLPNGQQWGRTEILIHPANKVSDLLGCIAVGTRHFCDNNEYSVLESRMAMDQLRAVLGSNRHFLTIQPTRGTI